MIDFCKEFGEAGEAFATVLRHAGVHVGTNAFAIVENFVQPLRAKFRSDQSERRRNAGIVAESFFAGIEMDIEMRSDSAVVVTLMTGDAVELSQAKFDLLSGLDRFGRFLQCCLQCFDLIIIQIEVR